MPDSALINPGKPFFIPEDMPGMVASLVAALKINRLGKTIAPRFAHRYFSEVAVGAHFFSPRLQKELAAKGFPTDRARAFDRSLFLSDSIASETFHSSPVLAFIKNGVVEMECQMNIDNSSIGPAIAAVSADNTLKMGDLVIPLHAGEVDVNIGDTVVINCNSKPLLRIEIK